MPHVKVHNITDRPNTPGGPLAVPIGPDKIRPGKAKMIDVALLNQKVWQMHGKRIWIGEHLPGRFTRTSKSALKVKARELSDPGAVPMDIAEARQYLDVLSVGELRELCNSVVPVLEFGNTPIKKVLVARLGRVLFMKGKILDPEKFFWLRRWTRVGDTYVERE